MYKSTPLKRDIHFTGKLSFNFQTCISLIFDKYQKYQNKISPQGYSNPQG